MVRSPVTQPQAARVGGWLSLLVIAGHSVLVYLAFGKGWFPIPIDPFVRWELLNIEFCFTLLVLLTSWLAIRHARFSQRDVRTPRAATTALAVLWTGDAICLAIVPMPLPAAPDWLHIVLPLVIGTLALVCWFAALAQEVAIVQESANAVTGFTAVPGGSPRARE